MKIIHHVHYISYILLFIVYNLTNVFYILFLNRTVLSCISHIRRTLTNDIWDHETGNVNYMVFSYVHCWRISYYVVEYNITVK